jgi:spermidine synthase
MGGMCLGSVGFINMPPRLVPARFHPLRVYGAIEVAIGLLGLLVLLLMPSTVSTAASVALLLPPTLLMGATLPALARCVGEPSHLGFLYAANIAGAVFGSLLAGFYLLRVFDVATATCVAAAINTVIAAIALAFPSPLPPAPNITSNPEQPANPIILLAIALSGFTALAAEALWTRTLGLLFGASVYTLSIILAVFLTGLGIGSAVGSFLCRTLASPRRALGISQLLLAAAIAWTAYTLTASLPYWPINPSISSNIWFNFELDLARALWAVLPPTLLWGASFPFALAAASASDKGEQMARVYAANTLGAIAGALLTALFLVPQFGTQRAGQLLIAISTIAGLLLLLDRKMLNLKMASIALVAAAIALCALLIHTVPPLSNLLVAYGRYAATWVGKSDIVYAGEGLNSSVAVARFPNDVVTFNVAGKVQASNVPRDMRLQRMLGHLTTLTVAEPRSVLVIGCGAGITAGAVSIDPRVERETIVEIEPLVPRAASTWFSEPNFDVLRNPKVRVILDDGRHFLLTTQDRFDGITVDPLDPWVKGAANLYTREFYEAMKRHLNPGGSVTMYIQLFETNLDAVRSALATFFEAFPNGTVWGNTYLGEGHDLVLLGNVSGQVEPFHIDLDAMEQRFGYRDPSNKIPQSLAEVGMNSPEDLFANYAGRASDLTPWLRGAALNRDRNLRMQYLAGLGLNLDNAASIYSAIIANRAFPSDMFTSTAGRLDSLRLALQATSR